MRAPVPLPVRGPFVAALAFLRAALAVLLAATPAALMAQRDPSVAAREALDVVAAATRLRPAVVITLSVTSHAGTAEEAAQRSSLRMIGLLTALRRQGLRGDAILPSGQVVAREGEWDGTGRAPHDDVLLTEFAARHRVRVVLTDLDQLGALVDTALANGATGVHGIAMATPADLPAQREALTEALHAVREDAIALLAPREGRLQRLLQLGVLVRALSCR
jgi:uncharacterized protein YggE